MESGAACARGGVKENGSTSSNSSSSMSSIISPAHSRNSDSVRVMPSLDWACAAGTRRRAQCSGGPGHPLAHHRCGRAALAQPARIKLQRRTANSSAINLCSISGSMAIISFSNVSSRNLQR